MVARLLGLSEGDSEGVKERCQEAILKTTPRVLAYHSIYQSPNKLLSSLKS